MNLDKDYRIFTKSGTVKIVKFHVTEKTIYHDLSGGESTKTMALSDFLKEIKDWNEIPEEYYNSNMRRPKKK